MTTPTAATQDAVLRDLLGDELDAAALPLPARVPCAAALEREAIAMRDYLQAATARAARQLLVTVRPARCAS